MLEFENRTRFAGGLIPGTDKEGRDRLTVAATAWLFVTAPKDFLPSGDTGQIIAFTEGQQDASFAAMVERQRMVAAILAQDPNIDGFMSSVGAGGPRPTANTGTFFIRLKPRAERALSADELIQALRPKLAGVPGIRCRVRLMSPSGD